LLAGYQTLYYLYFWEWVRAQLAATMLVATLVVGAAWLMLGRIDRLQRHLDERLDELAGGAPAVAATPRGPAAARTPAPDLPWLDPRFAPPARSLLLPALLGVAAAPGPRPAVFIPVLLGTGVLVSVAAGLVERLGAATHREDTAPAAPAPPDSSPETGADTRRRPPVRFAGIAVLAVLVPAAVWWSAHDFERGLPPGRTELTVRVESRSDRSGAPVDTVGTVGRYCARNAIRGVRVEQVLPGGPGTAVLVVSPALDEQAARRYGGCLEDGVLFRHRLTVIRDVVRPAGR
jgi:hypothetical protein